MKKSSNNLFVLKREEKEKKEISPEKYELLIKNPILIILKEEFAKLGKQNDEKNNSNEDEKEEKINIIFDDNLSNEFDEQSLIDKKKLRRGRWTAEEHRNFLKGIIKYGNDWKMVEKIVKTRTSSQSRSHAQKYFLKFKNIVEQNNFNENNLYDFITGEFSMSFLYDISFSEFNLEDKKKLANAFISYSNIFEKNKRRKKSVDNSNKMKLESKNSDNKSFHSDEDDEEISLKNEQKNILNNKRKRSDVKIFNIVKSVKYKESEEYIKNKNDKLNNKINNTKIKYKFFVKKNIPEKKSKNKGNNNKNSSHANNNYIINNNIFNINNKNNFDLNSLNIFNCNINTININNINYINNESNKNIIENSDKNIFDKLDNNILSFSQKNLSYDFLRPNFKNYNEGNLSENEEEELSSFDKRNKTYFISPI